MPSANSSGYELTIPLQRVEFTWAHSLVYMLEHHLSYFTLTRYHHGGSNFFWLKLNTLTNFLSPPPKKKAKEKRLLIYYLLHFYPQD